MKYRLISNRRLWNATNARQGRTLDFTKWHISRTSTVKHDFEINSHRAHSKTNNSPTLQMKTRLPHNNRVPRRTRTQRAVSKLHTSAERHKTESLHKSVRQQNDIRTRPQPTGWLSKVWELEMASVVSLVAVREIRFPVQETFAVLFVRKRSRGSGNRPHRGLIRFGNHCSFV